MDKALVPGQDGAKTPPFWAAHTYVAYIGEYTTGHLFSFFLICYYN